MNKKELTAKVAKTCSITQVKAAEVVNAIFDADKGIIAGELNGGNKVTIPGFGTFEPRVRAARTGTNPSTKKKLEIKAKHYARVHAGKTLRENLAKKKVK